MQSISEILNNIDKEKTSSRSERAELIGQIYDFYKEDTRKQNWKRYIKWLKEKRLKHSLASVDNFKHTKVYFKTRNIKSFCFLLSHIKTKDLYYIISLGKDKKNRGENFSGWLFGEIYKK